jgi:hypothetical protein
MINNIIFDHFLFLKTDALKQSLAKATTNEVKAKLKEAVEYGEYRFNINNEDMRTYILKNFDIFPPRIDEDQGISVQQQPDSEKKKPSQETVKNQAKSVNKKSWHGCNEKSVCAETASGFKSTN